MAMHFFYFLLIGTSLLKATAAYTQEASADQITEMPGADSLYSNQFSGYLNISDDKLIHYVYYESENNPVTDPVVFWTNGGPGCSGLLGLFTEFGPWRPISGTAVARNPATWSKLVSLVFLEQPAGVGFSIQNITAGEKPFIWNDFRASRDNLAIIKTFFKRFPERAGNPFYIASESYGGHYMPQLALQILDDEQGGGAAAPQLRDRFLGMLVGNPYTSFASGMVAGLNVAWGLQLLPHDAW